MDLMYIIILWLKSFLGHMQRITSFIGGSFLPGGDDLEEDVETTEPTTQRRPGRK